MVAKPPSALEYGFIKLIDNAFPASVLALIFVFVGLGAYFRSKSQELSAVWCFDAAKLCLGVFLGAISQKSAKKG
jgi:hypothetical protein